MDLGKNIQQSIELYKNNFAPIFIASLLAGLVSGVTFGILAGPLTAGLFLLILKIIRGEKGEFNEIFAHFDKFVPTLIVAIICFVAMAVAGIIPILGVILGLVVNPAISMIFALSIMLIVDRNMEPMDAIKQAVEYFKTNPVMLWVYVLVMGLVAALGIIACGIGILVTSPIATIGMALAYEQLSGNTTTTVNSEPNINA